MEIEIVNDDILNLDVEAIVNPANSYGYMGGGLAAVLRDALGQEVEDEVVHYAPIPIGHAVLTGGGSRSEIVVIHAPTMEQPAGYTDIEIVKQATLAALNCAEEHKITSLAFPGMGTGVGGLDKQDAANAMMRVILTFSPQSLKRVVLCALNEDLFEAFGKAFGQKSGLRQR